MNLGNFLLSEKADPNWHMFRVSQLLENSEQTDDYYTKLESLLKLNLAIQQRTKNAIKRLQVVFFSYF